MLFNTHSQVLKIVLAGLATCRAFEVAVLLSSIYVEIDASHPKLYRMFLTLAR